MSSCSPLPGALDIVAALVQLPARAEQVPAGLEILGCTYLDLSHYLIFQRPETPGEKPHSPMQLLLPTSRLPTWVGKPSQPIAQSHLNQLESVI